jgi:hypothetical protein
MIMIIDDDSFYDDGITQIHIAVPKSIKSATDYISDLFKINVTLRTTKDVSTSTLERTVVKKYGTCPQFSPLISFSLRNLCHIHHFVLAFFQFLGNPHTQLDLLLDVRAKGQVDDAL